jgi:branched-chain amino acid transport system substrate-binding protein
LSAVPAAALLPATGLPVAGAQVRQAGTLCGFGDGLRDVSRNCPIAFADGQPDTPQARASATLAQPYNIAFQRQPHRENSDHKREDEMVLSLLRAASLAALLVASPAALFAEEAPFRIGVIDDMSGIYSGNGGPGTVLAAKLAVEDFGGKVLGRPIEVVSADHQSKPDIGSALARQFIEQQGVRAIIPGGASSVGLAVQALASSLKKTTLVSGGYASNFSAAGCSPYGTQWAPSTSELSKTIAKGIVEGGGKKWFFIVADYVFGKNLAADAGDTVKASGGEVIGQVLHPLNVTDLASQLLAAQGSGADVIGLADAGPDLVLAIKQAREFGVSAKLATMLVFENNVTALGLDTAQGLRLAASFYWDLNEETRAWSKRFMARNGDKVPTMGHVLAYLATTHYLKAVAAVGSDDAAQVQAKMLQQPIEGNLIQHAHIQANGRVVSDMHIFEVKSPKTSKGPADLYKLVATLPGEGLFVPAEKSGCPLHAAR